MKKKITSVVSIVLAVVLVMTAFTACNGSSGSANKVKLVNIALTDELYAFGVSKNDADLLESVNEYIAEVKANGTLDAINEKYFGSGTPEGVVSAEKGASDNQLVVVTNAEFAPFEYKEGDTYYGVDMELVKGLADKLGKELVILNVDFDSVTSNVEAGYADLAAAGLTVSEKRQKQVNFSESYYTASQYLIALADDTKFDNCKTAADVEAVLNAFDSSVQIGYQSETTGQYYVNGDEDWGFDGFNVSGKGYDSGALAATDMLNGNLSYVIIDAAPAEFIVKSINGK